MTPEAVAHQLNEQVDEEADAMPIREALTVYANVGNHCRAMVAALRSDLKREDNHWTS